MNGFIKKTAAALFSGAALLTLIGCQHYRDVVDSCWPERYNDLARKSVKHMHNAQSDKGHLLDHTLWTGDFDGNDLKPSGKAKLKYIANREPVAVVMKVWLQNADDEAPAKRANVNADRKMTITAFLDTQKSEGRTSLYEIEVHNYTQPTHPSDWTNKALKNLETNIEGGKAQKFESGPSSSSGGSK